MSLAEGKLVRDKLVPLIAKTSPIMVKSLVDESLMESIFPALLLKLREELLELSYALQGAGDVAEEAADCIEVLLAIAANAGIDASEVERKLDSKYEEKGGFDDLFFVKLLDGTEED